MPPQLTKKNTTMKFFFYTLFSFAFCSVAFSQEDEQAPITENTEYRETAWRLHDLKHTKLDITPDFAKQYVYGKAWITLQPHFYTLDSVELDAKGMNINKVALVNGTKMTPLKFSYNELKLNIKLDKKYTRNETYTLYIDYTAKPDEYEAKYGKNQMLGVKGFYFINPLGEDKDKPTQIWTQGETESNSAWFPTIDATNQKTTQELTVTVDKKYVTLSNGKLMSQKANTNGTRTDYWKMDLPHAPYLFFVGVGEYAMTKDSWRGKEVNYYVEKEYASVAKRIFGNTPEMMTYFSKITGVDYPWIKYSQITGRDYVAGAMENTTATIHQENAQQDARSLTDENAWEGTIAHELFHQWFGDYVTTESWSNLTLNESFADYSQTLWEEYKYGQDAGDFENYKGMQDYLNSGSEEKNLVRFHYDDPLDMFDAVSYQKGGRILHMLRKLVGDEAFFKSLNVYLTTNKFKSAEAQQLRLAFEEVTGRDLNWFFNQWYYNNGHPKVVIDYLYDDKAGIGKVIFQQKDKEKIFRLPIAIDVYENDKKVRHSFTINNATDTFTFAYKTRPQLVNADAEKITLWQKEDKKDLDNILYQYTHAENLMDRMEAVQYAALVSGDSRTDKIIKYALQDKFPKLRIMAIKSLKMDNNEIREQVKPILLSLAKTDNSRLVKAQAIRALGTYKNKEWADLYKKAVYDSSYSVAGYALNALYDVDSAAASRIAMDLKKAPSKGVLNQMLEKITLLTGDLSGFDELIQNFNTAEIGEKFGMVEKLAVYLGALQDVAKFKTGLDAIVSLKKAAPEAYVDQVNKYINELILPKILANKTAALQTSKNIDGIKAQIEMINNELPKNVK